MKLLKQSLGLVFILLLIFSIIPISTASAAVSKQFPIRSYSIGDYDGCQIYAHQGGNIKVRVVQKGVHGGEQADTIWTLRNFNTGKLISTTYLPYDYNSTFTLYGVPKGDYTLTWISDTNNDTQGWYQVTSNGGSIVN